MANYRCLLGRWRKTREHHPGSGAAVGDLNGGKREKKKGIPEQGTVGIWTRNRNDGPRIRVRGKKGGVYEKNWRDFARQYILVHL